MNVRTNHGRRLDRSGRGTDRRRLQRGYALLSALLVMGLMSALLVGFFAIIQADQQAAGINRDQTQAYAAAHAGLEKLTADLGGLFVWGNYSPTTAQLTALTSTPPTIPGFQFIAPNGGSGYTVTQQATVASTIPNGPFQGLQALLTPYQVDVVARASSATLGGAAEVKMRRILQTASIPVFQFGMFSENDLSFFAGVDFNFGGRVHTNQNLYLAEQSATLRLSDVVTAVGEVVRTYLPNGLAISTSGHQGLVSIATTSGTNPVYRNLNCGNMGGSCAGSPAAGEGSAVVTSVPPATLQTVNGAPTMVLTSGNTPNEPTWTNVATGAYNNRIRNGRTGAKRLDLPIVSDGALPIDLIRRPSISAPDTTEVLQQRYFKNASLRILLSDRASDITGLPTVTAAPPVSLARLAKDPSYRTTNNGLGTALTLLNSIPFAQAGTRYAPGTTGTNAGKAYDLPSGAPTEDGYLKIERQDRNGNWSDVTIEILNLGFTGRSLSNNGAWNSPGTTCSSGTQNDPSPSAVIRLQRVRDNPSSSYSPCGHVGGSSSSGAWSTTATDYLPNVLYDSREGARRDDPSGQGSSPKMAGVMHYVEIDVNNLRQWIAASHPDTMDVTGYVVYFSDRRGNKDLGGDGVASARAGADGVLYTTDDFGDDRETGELGFEDIINPASPQSVSNGVLDTGEDVNGNGVLDTYGGVARQYPLASGSYVIRDSGGSIVWSAAANATASYWVLGTTVALDTAVTVEEARVNPPVFFRRALKVVDGAYSSGALRLPHNGPQGLSIASENPLYVQGNFNGPNAGATDFGSTPGTDHVSAAMIADAVTLLSNSFNDIGTFVAPHDVTNAARAASTTWYRMGVIAGKGLNFPRPTSNTANDHTDFGTDGGAHNFLRYIENWSGDTLNYRGSIVSFFISRQAVGTYKCCNVVYEPPTRGYKFDTDFLTPSLLPPRTPMFRDINTLTFRQLLRPNQ
jgi:hypothetical protein